MAVFAYADETIFEMDKSKDLLTLGCGIFITKHEITQEIIDEAFNSLKMIYDLKPDVV